MQGNKTTEDFDFEHWAGMAKKNPEAFETMRKKYLDELIEQAPERIRHRMKGLQWQVDVLRERSANPMAACLSISQMMWDSVVGERGLLETLEAPFSMERSKADSKPQNIIQLKGCPEP